jgi:hypothetical protein
MLILAILIPAVASADDTAGTPSEEAAAATSAQAARPVVGPPEPKRRASMVGYIDDATIDTHVRVRFDAAGGANAPDRSEFFYAQCGCNGPTAPGPGNPGPGDLVTDLRFQELNVEGQYAVKTGAVKDRIAVFATIPLRFVQPQTFLGQTLIPPQPNTFTSQSGFGDIRVGAKGGIISNDDVLLTVEVEGFFKTGDAKEGLGTNHNSLQTELLLNGRVSDRVIVEGQFGDWHPFGGSTFNGQSYSGDVLFYGIGPSYEAIRTDHVRVWPVVELVGWHVLGGLVVVPPVTSADGTNIVNVKVGARVIFDDRSSIYAGWGTALTDQVWYKDIVRFEYRYAF